MTPQEEANLILACALRDSADELERVAVARLRWAEEAMEWRERAERAETLLAALVVAWEMRRDGEG